MTQQALDGRRAPVFSLRLSPADRGWLEAFARKCREELRGDPRFRMYYFSGDTPPLGPFLVWCARKLASTASYTTIAPSADVPKRAPRIRAVGGFSGDYNELCGCGHAFGAHEARKPFACADCACRRFVASVPARRAVIPAAAKPSPTYAPRRPNTARRHLRPQPAKAGAGAPERPAKKRTMTREEINATMEGVRAFRLAKQRKEAAKKIARSNAGRRRRTNAKLHR